MKRTLSLTLALLMLAATACGGEGGEVETSAAETTTAAVETEEEYIYPEVSYNGAEFTILDSEQDWGMYSKLDVEEQNGEPLDDAVFERNSYVEEKFDVDIKVVMQPIGDKAKNEYLRVIMAGENTYEAALLTLGTMNPFVVDGYLTDLSAYEEFRFNQPYWDQALVETLPIGKSDKLYIASSDFSLYGFECTISLFVNKNICADYNLTLPYDSVRNGTWTFDEFRRYMKVGTNLNGDSALEYTEDGNCTWGLSTYSTAPLALFTSADSYYFRKNEQNEPYLAIENDRYYSTAEQIAAILFNDGCTIMTPDMLYEELFRDGRALFNLAQIKTSNKFRDMKDSFGILPLPKFDAEQENYFSYRTTSSLVISVPVTNPEPEKAGVILDALSYLSYRDILPIYFDITLSQKNLRDDDSIEMLELIRDTRFFPFDTIYSLNGGLMNAVHTKLMAGDSDIASTVASYKTTVAERIKTALEMMNG